MADFLLNDLAGVSSRALDTAGSASYESSTGTIAFFDLVGSTALKRERGHRVGATKAREYVGLTSDVSTACGGEVMKSMGDGILAYFDDPIAACAAALSVKKACIDHGIRSSAGLALGVVDVVTEVDGRRDVTGSVVDKAARLESLALPGQTLIDAALHEAVVSHLSGEEIALLDGPLEVNAKGFDGLRVYELSLKEVGVTRVVVPRFEVYPEGRMTLQEKTRFARQARVQIQEFGTGLTAFAQYFIVHRPGEFKDHIRRILERGVDLNCYGLAPSSRWVEFVVQTSGADYVEAAARAREAIINERNGFVAEGLPGELRYFEYDHVPEFHGFCIDPEDAINAQILISPYLPGMARAEAPVYQVSRVGHQTLYDKYRLAMQAIEATAHQVDS